MVRPETNSTRSRIRWFASIETFPPLQLNDWSVPPVVDWFQKQMSAGEVPFAAVTAKVMFKTVPVDVERSSEADHCPADIVSGADSRAVTQHAAYPLDSARSGPRL